MKTIYSDRRENSEDFRSLDHAIDLVQTHGWRYAAMYLRSQRIAEPTLQRVLFGAWSSRRASANKLIVCQRLLAGSNH